MSLKFKKFTTYVNMCLPVEFNDSSEISTIGERNSRAKSVLSRVDS